MTKVSFSCYFWVILGIGVDFRSFTLTRYRQLAHHHLVLKAQHYNKVIDCQYWHCYYKDTREERSQKLTEIDEDKKTRVVVWKQILNKYFKACTKSHLKLHHIKPFNLILGLGRPQVVWNCEKCINSKRGMLHKMRVVLYVFYASFCKITDYSQVFKEFDHLLVFIASDPFINFDTQPVTCDAVFQTRAMIILERTHQMKAWILSIQQDEFLTCLKKETESWKSLNQLESLRAKYQGVWTLFCQNTHIF